MSPTTASPTTASPPTASPPTASPPTASHTASHTASPTTASHTASHTASPTTASPPTASPTPGLIPTEEQLHASEEYAVKKLCTFLPSKFDTNLTEWDDKMKACRITPRGCAPSSTSPFSRVVYDGFGNLLDVVETEQNTSYKDFWSYNKWQPDMYVYKMVSGQDKPVCARANNLLYRWCEYPQTRVGEDGFGSEGIGYTDVPPFKYTVRNQKETCIIGPDYCKNRGVSYDGTYGNEHCYVEEWQQLAEFLGSDVLVRYAVRGT